MKIFLLLRFISSHRHLLVEHVKNYAALFSEQTISLLESCRNKIVSGIFFLCFSLIAVVLGGVGLMLWAVVPPETMKAPWILVVVPLAPAIIAGWCGWMTCRKSINAFSELKHQVSEDIKLFEQARSS